MISHQIRMPTIAAICFLASASAFVSVSQGESLTQFRTVVLSGASTAGLPPGVFFQSIRDDPTINESGQTAFRAILGGDGVNEANEHAILSEGRGGLHLVARTEDAAPETPPGVVFHANFPSIAFIGGYALNDLGNVTIQANVAGPGFTGLRNQGLWAETDSGMQLIALENFLAPDSPQQLRFEFVNAAPANNADVSVYLGRGENIVSGETRAGWWRYQPGDLQPWLLNSRP